MSRVKIIAYYLPQFHEVKENNEWWEPGFTEWTTVKRAKPQYNGHVQPVIPLDDRYYSLENRETIVWQTELAKAYDVYGFAYYHYWFEGKKLLEKPAENLLRDSSIPQNFLFVWANHSWIKSVEGKSTILQQQGYGDKEDWIAHYNYLLPFFMDDRYIKCNNRPVFVIYNPNQVGVLDEMMKLWDELAKKDGFDGIYLLESLNSEDTRLFCEYSQGGIIRQPNVAKRLYWQTSLRGFCQKIIWKINSKLGNEKAFGYNYNIYSACELKCKRTLSDGKKLFYGIATGWDNTPRHGKFGSIIKNITPKKFKHNMEVLYRRSISENNEFMFVNAWNEWAEGMYLEPDVNNKYAFLQAIKEVVNSNV